MKHYPRIILVPLITISESRSVLSRSRIKQRDNLKHPAAIPTNSSHHRRPAMNFELRGGGGDPLVGPNMPTFVLKPANFSLSKLSTLFVVKPLSE